MNKNLLDTITKRFELSKLLTKNYKKRIGVKKDGTLDKRTNKYKLFAGK